MKNMFVTYELAKQLKEKGFIEPCVACYDKCGMLSTYSTVFKPLNYNDDKSSLCISAPLYQQVVNWFREKHNYFINVIPSGEDWLGIHNKIESNYHSNRTKYFNEYYDALNKTIEEALKLI